MGQASRLSLPLVLVLLVLSVAWAWRHPPYPHDPESNAWAARYERIGLDVNHSDRVISLDGHYGFPLSYHGRLVASNWPLSIDMAVSTLAGRSTAPAAESRLAATGGEFFVATLQSELDAQPDLGALLNERYPVIDRDGTPDHWNYVVYDLRRTRVSVTPSAVSAFGRVADPSHLAHTVHLWAAPGAKWRIAIPRPDLLDVSPTEGTGPAVLTVVPRRLSASVDVRLDVAILGGGDVPSGSFTVRVRTVPAGARVAPFGFVDAPADPVTPTDAPIVFQGWALDDLSVRRVWVELGDRRLAGHSVRMLAETVPGDLRPDVATAYPNASDVFHSAWALTLPPDVVRALPRPAVLHFFAEDSDGLRAELGMRTIR